MKKTDPSDVKALAAWCRTVFRFIEEKAGGGGAFAQPAQVVEMLEASQDRRGLTMVKKDLEEAIRGLSAEQRIEIESRLVAIGDDPPRAAQKRAAEIARVLRRGVAETREEFDLLLGRVEEIFQDETRQAEVAAIKEVLGTSRFT